VQDCAHQGIAQGWGFMLVLPAQTLEQIASLRRSWWRQYLIEFAKLILKK
jgi:hypothetical protein